MGASVFVALLDALAGWPDSWRMRDMHYNDDEVDDEDVAMNSTQRKK